MIPEVVIVVLSVLAGFGVIYLVLRYLLSNTLDTGEFTEWGG